MLQYDIPVAPFLGATLFSPVAFTFIQFDLQNPPVFYCCWAIISQSCGRTLLLMTFFSLYFLRRFVTLSPENLSGHNADILIAFHDIIIIIILGNDFWRTGGYLLPEQSWQRSTTPLGHNKFAGTVWKKRCNINIEFDCQTHKMQRH